MLILAEHLFGVSGGSWDDALGGELGEFSEVLGGGGEEELVIDAVETSQAQAVELQDTFEVGKQHFHLLPFSP